MASIVIVLGGVARFVVQADVGASESFWQSFERVIDLGSLANDSGWGARLASLALVVAGILLSAVVLAIVVTEFQSMLERIHEGHLEFPWDPDIAVVGWSDQIITLINELALSPHGKVIRIAVVGTPSRKEMEDLVRRECRGAMALGAVVECRSGDPADPRVLIDARVHDAERVVVFGRSGATDDSETVKAVLAVLHAGVDLDRTILGVEVCSEEATAAVDLITGGRALTISSNDVIALVLAQAVRSRGMSRVMHELTSYEGCEIYVEQIPDGWIGRRFSQVVLAARNCSPIGLAGTAEIVVRPDGDREIAAHDRLLVVAPTKQPVLLAEPSDPIALVPPSAPNWSEERVLVIGWNPLAAKMVAHLTGFLSEASVIYVCANETLLDDASTRTLQPGGHIEKIFLEAGSTTCLARAGELLADVSFDAVAIVPYRGSTTAGQADAETLVTIAYVQHRLEELGATSRVVAELRESRSSRLASLIHPDDLVLSDAISASLMAQLVDRPELDSVFGDLLDFRGSAVFVHPLDRWLDGAPANTFDDLIPRIMARNEVPIGLRVGSGVELAPDRSTSLVDGSVDGIIVIGAGVDWREHSVSPHISGIGD